MPEIEIWGGFYDGKVIHFPDAPKAPFHIQMYAPPEYFRGITDVPVEVLISVETYHPIGKNSAGRILYSMVDRSKL